MKLNRIFLTIAAGIAWIAPASAFGGGLFKKRDCAPACIPAPTCGTIVSVQPAMAPAPAVKTYTIAFNETPWPDVFDWFSKESGLTFIDTVKPPGTLTIRSDRKYTLPQVLDLLNEALAQKKMVIIRRSQTFLVHPADERLPPELVQMITLDELASRGDSELVQVILPVGPHLSEDIAPQIKKLLSPLGTASAFGLDQMIVLDKAKNIRNILNYIKSLDNDCSVFHYQCKYVRITFLTNQLQHLLTDPSDLEGGKPRPNARPVNISVDHASNSLRMTAPAEKYDLARQLIKYIDTGCTLREIGGKEFWKTYNVTPGTAEALAKAIMMLLEFKGSGIQLLPIGTSQVQVYGLPADHHDIVNYLKMPLEFWEKPIPAAADAPPQRK